MRDDADGAGSGDGSVAGTPNAGATVTLARATDDGPDYKDQVQGTASHSTRRNNLRRFSNESAVAVIVPEAEATHVTDRQLDEESQRYDLSSPQDSYRLSAGSPSEMQEPDLRAHIVCVVPRNTCVWMAVIVVILGAVIGGFCGMGKCGAPSSGERNRDASTASFPSDNNPRRTATPSAPLFVPAPTPSSQPPNGLSPVSFQSTEAPTNESSPAATKRSHSISNYIKNVTHTTSLTSPDYMAITWLISQDPLRLTDDTPSGQFRLRQRYALASLLFNTNQSATGWDVNVNWLTTPDECFWHGITCEEMEYGGDVGHQKVVVSIILPNNRLKGPLPHALELLDQIRYLRLESNGLTGTVPESIANCDSLMEFAVTGNCLSGSLPDQIGSRWTDLQEFSAGDNLLTGALPSSIGDWRNLTTFNVESNNLNGTLPDSIGQWSNVQQIYTNGNNITGTLPSSIGQWTALEKIYVHANSHSGTLPDSLGMWSNVRIFCAASNSFSGLIPAAIGNWSSVEQAYFSDNGFTGVMPSGICNVSSLMVLEADPAVAAGCSCCSLS